MTVEELRKDIMNASKQVKPYGFSLRAWLRVKGRMERNIKALDRIMEEHLGKKWSEEEEKYVITKDEDGKET